MTTLAQSPFAMPMQAPRPPSAEAVRRVNDLHGLALRNGTLKICVRGETHEFKEWTAMCQWVVAIGGRIGTAKVALRDQRIAFGHICVQVQAYYRTLGDRHGKRYLWDLFVETCGLHRRTLDASMRVARMFADDQGRLDVAKVSARIGEAKQQQAANTEIGDAASIRWQPLVVLSRTGVRAGKAREERRGNVGMVQQMAHAAANGSDVRGALTRHGSVDDAGGRHGAADERGTDRSVPRAPASAVDRGSPSDLRTWRGVATPDASHRAEAGADVRPASVPGVRSLTAATGAAQRGDAEPRREGRGRVDDVRGQMFIGDLLAGVRLRLEQLHQALARMNPESIAVAGDLLAEFERRLGGVVSA